MSTPAVFPVTFNDYADYRASLDAFDAAYGDGSNLTLSASVLKHEADVYDADPTGGQPSAY